MTVSKRAPIELQTAQRVLEEAQGNLTMRYSDAAISRGYYAIFHAARAAVYSCGGDPITHRGVVSEFNRLLIKPGLIEQEYQAILKSARDRRTVADYETYELELLPTLDMAQDTVEKARTFVTRVQKLLEKMEA